jgi:hypothetical protein
VSFVNRVALIVRPKRRYKEWVEIIDLRVAKRIVPAVVPSDDSPAGKRGVAAVSMFCSKDCGRAFEDAWSRERGLLDS